VRIMSSDCFISSGFAYRHPGNTVLCSLEIEVQGLHVQRRCRLAQVNVICRWRAHPAVS
jgi:hypothetical protein